MMKVSELSGFALDWAVATIFNPSDEWGEWKPSANWSQAGPIIEQERIDIRWSGQRWIASLWPDNSGMIKNPAQRYKHNTEQGGPTPLIAAMRCYVTSKLCEEITVPEAYLETSN